jgi:hypothetical protein
MTAIIINRCSIIGTGDAPPHGKAEKLPGDRRRGRLSRNIPGSDTRSGVAAAQPGQGVFEMLRVMIGTGRGIGRRARPAARHSGTIRAIAHVAAIAGLAFGFGVASGPVRAQVQITDLADLGNEVAERINSVAAVLNGRFCLTDEEKKQLTAYLDGLDVQLFNDYGLLGKAGYLHRLVRSVELANDRAPLSAGERARVRLFNLRREIRRYRKEIKDYPICMPGSSNPQIGFFIGGHFIKPTGDVKSTERLDATDQVTNQFSDRKDPVGGGLIVGAKYTPWANNVVLAPFASFDFLHAAVNHTFANGSFLGSTANFIGTLGVKVGPQLQDFWLYGIAGVSVLNETLNVNFLPVTSSTDTIVPGATVGGGLAYKLPNLPNVSLFAEYQHTWWREGKFNTPLASPLFDYSFGRQDNVVKLGFTVAIGSPSSPASAPGYPVKALPK